MKGKTALTMFFVAIANAFAAVAQGLVPEVEAMKTQYEAKVKADVDTPFEAGKKDLNTKYQASIERALDTATKAGKLDEALALKAEQQLISTGGEMPKEDEEKTPASLKQLRGVYRTSMARMTAERAKRLQPLQANVAKSLDGVVSRLTKDGKLAEASAVKEYRDSLTASENIATVDDLVRKPWEKKGDRPGIWTFSRDKTVLVSGGYKGEWTIRGKVLRAEFSPSSWAEYSLEIQRVDGDMVLKELDSARGKHDDTVLVQSTK